MVTEMASLIPQGRVRLPCCPLTPDGSFPGAPPTGRVRRGSLEEGGSEMDAGGWGWGRVCTGEDEARPAGWDSMRESPEVGTVSQPYSRSEAESGGDNGRAALMPETDRETEMEKQLHLSEPLRAGGKGDPPSTPNPPPIKLRSPPEMLPSWPTEAIGCQALMDLLAPRGPLAAESVGEKSV